MVDATDADDDDGAEKERVRRLPGGMSRPVGDMRSLLEDLRARGLRCSSILDVGAHRGDWSRMARAVWPTARFCLIEPLEELRSALESFCAEAPGSRCVLAAAGAETGERALALQPERPDGATFLRECFEWESWTPCIEERTVPVVTIDGLLERGAFPAPQLAKLDVQGAELEALAGARRLFGPAEPVEVFILEVAFFRFAPGWPVFHEVVAFMAERGYVPYDFAGFARRFLDGALGQTDACVVREAGPLRAAHKWM
jgi:FkbM family methyltransferase